MNNKILTTILLFVMIESVAQKMDTLNLNGL